MNSSVDLSRRKEPRISDDAAHYLEGLRYVVDSLDSIAMSDSDFRQEVEYVLAVVKFKYDVYGKF